MYQRLNGGGGCLEDATVECTWYAEKNRGILAVSHHQTQRPSLGRQNLLGWRMTRDRESDREWEGGRCRQAIFPQGIKSVGSHEDDAEREQKLVCPSLLQCTARLFPPAPAPSSYAGRAGRKYKAIRQWKRHEGKITAAAPSVNFRQPSQ